MKHHMYAETPRSPMGQDLSFCELISMNTFPTHTHTRFNHYKMYQNNSAIFFLSQMYSNFSYLLANLLPTILNGVQVLFTLVTPFRLESFHLIIDHSTILYFVNYVALLKHIVASSAGRTCSEHWKAISLCCDSNDIYDIITLVL